MLLILFYWFYLFFVTTTLGSALVRIIDFKKIDSIITPILGLFVVTILGSIYAIFDCLSFKFEISLLVLSVICSILYYRSFYYYLCLLNRNFQKFTVFSKVLFISVFILALAQSSTAPYLIDNESYYLPTIKWLDTYGFVPGLANLHIFLAQTSGWHIGQSALNLDFIYSEFNDINGYFLILGAFYSFDKLNEYFINKEFHLLIIGLFPIFYILLFQFISAPSPDLPIYMLTIIIFGEYFRLVHLKYENGNIVLVILVLFAIYIKVTTVLLLIIPILTIKLFNKKEMLISLVLSIVVFTLFITKNLIISGFPFYPLEWFKFHHIDWQLPQSIMDYIRSSTKFNSFYKIHAEYKTKSVFDLFVDWISLPKLHGIFNILMVMLLLIFPITFKRSKNKNIFILVYIISFSQLLLLSNLSPQYRFFLNYLMILVLILLAFVFSNRLQLIKYFITFSIFLITLPLFFNLTVSTLTNNQLMQSLGRFKSEYLFEPHVKTRYKDAIYAPFVESNTVFFAPINIEFYWGVGDGPLPSIQKDQYNYFKETFKVVPVQRTENLKNGFYSKQIRPDSTQ